MTTSLTGLGIIFLSLTVPLLLFLPRRLAVVPLLIGTLYMTLGQKIVIGSFNFYTVRLLILVGIVRVVLRGERLGNGLNRIDRLFLLWSAWALFSSIFHKDPAAALKFDLGLVFNVCGSYFLLRIFVQSYNDVVRLYRVIIILLAAVALEMLQEQLTEYNMFSLLGGVSEHPHVRGGRIRSQGPFAHAILAGTVGAVCLPLAVAFWNQHRKTAIIGILGCTTMIIASASSGPVMSGLFSVGALLLWSYRHRMRFLRWIAIGGYVILEIVMNSPAYYILARIDVAGGSTGWHRARLMESAFEHLDEWWLGGTDYTRHWMPTGVSWSPDHADITNQYLQYGVTGGLPLMLLFIAILWTGFWYVGGALRRSSQQPLKTQFFIWALGASLAAHAATCISVTYFDQSFVFLCLTLAAIAAVEAGDLEQKASEGEDGARP